MTAPALWTGRCASRGLRLLGLGIGLVLLAVGVLIATFASAHSRVGLGPMIAGVVVALTVVWFSRLRVTVDDSMLAVSWGVARWPTKRVPWSKVRTISAIQVDPLSWGGWGYRWLPGRHASAAVVRRGPGIRLGLTAGRTFVVTVDDAVAGAQAAQRAWSAASRQAQL